MTRFSVIRASVKYIMMYSCASCFTTAPGTTQGCADTYFGSPDDIGDWLKKQKPNAHGMPEGWASHYGGKTGDVFTCRVCNRKKNLG